MSLCQLPEGKRGVVARIEGEKSLRDHLFRLGLVPGVPVKKVQGTGAGPMVLEVLGTNVLLGDGLAGGVEVRF